MAEAVAQHRLRARPWPAEAFVVASVYGVYTLTRNLFGSAEIVADGVPLQAFHNAERIIRAELALGLYHEQSVQAFFAEWTWFLQFWNAFYGIAHFVVTIGVLVALFLRRPQVYPRQRTALVVGTCVAIVGYSLFPLMPPRLLDAPCPDPATGVAEFGGRCIQSDLRQVGPDGERATVWVAPFAADDTFGYVDTMVVHGGPWSFQSDAITSISNQYAAMPSLHLAWSSWSAIAVAPLMRRRSTKIVAHLYPAVTLFCIVVTGNHFWLDGLGGLAVLGVGYLAAALVHRHPQATASPGVPSRG